MHLFYCGLPFESELAHILNKNIFETIYFAALTATNHLAKEKGAYESFPRVIRYRKVFSSLICGMYNPLPAGIGTD